MSDHIATDDPPIHAVKTVDGAEYSTADELGTAATLKAVTFSLPGTPARRTLTVGDWFVAAEGWIVGEVTEISYRQANAASYSVKIDYTNQHPAHMDNGGGPLVLGEDTDTDADRQDSPGFLPLGEAASQMADGMKTVR